ncbi:uncharacterized protein NECHADRAFT_86370 [Fusarium vanettenii 77-13-4]|uniref:Uncharacterized protein n=1 Tax=Fusarium vanettenii (strain ATCC MYA-4622 / CBS 123669 / FGSC 9596 / NRRL 45880 / 77-13-4) TaxID=660122 RepID=C7ZF29_FUSV7|nr:uncharacterized protein NECHADRAFT_86370 [Fusarium vanettenii 77-13-4]EEU37397.1 predicted protein [Fusarium vanettenii 77-13-4]
MCKHCANNGPLMIVGEPLSTYLEADAANKSWTLKFCEDLEAKLMIILSRRLRSDTMKYHDPNKVPAEVMGEMLVKDIGLNFDYKEEIRPLVIRGLLAQAKGTLSDVMAWDVIFKVENGKDENLFQWKVGFIFNNMTSVENAKKYIADKRHEENVIYQYRLRAAMAAGHPTTTTTYLRPTQHHVEPLVAAAPSQPGTVSQPATAPQPTTTTQPAPVPQPLTVDTQRAQGFVEGLDSISTSYSSLNLGSATNPITLDTDEDGVSSRYTHAHAPRVSSPLACVSPYTAADLVAQRSAVPRTRPETGFHQQIANVNAPGNHQPDPSVAKPPKRRPSARSTRTVQPPSRRRGRRANAG